VKNIAIPPLVTSFAAFVVGVAMLQISARLPPLPSLISFIAIAAWSICLVILKKKQDSPRWMWCWFTLMLFSAALTGYAYAGWRAASRMADELPSSWEGKDIKIVGVIDDLPATSERSVRFSFTVEEILTPDAIVPSRLALTWYRYGFNDTTSAQPLPALRAGARWQLTVHLKRPHGNANPGVFDTEAWLLQHRWRATGYVRNTLDNIESGAPSTSPMNYIQRMRENIRTRIETVLLDKPYAGVIVALAVGEQRAVPNEQWQIFNRSGITHLISISGLHVTIFSTLIGGLLFFIFRRFPRLTTRCPAIKLAIIAGFCASAFYVALAGAGIPAQRTLIMLAIAACGLWTQRLNQPFRIWLWALLIVVLWDPWAILAPGFWLSFGAVGWLLYAAQGRYLAIAPKQTLLKQARHSMLLGVHTQWVVTLGLIPLLLAIFQQFSLISLPANLWAIPWITLLVIPLTLIGMLPGLSALWIPAHFLIEFLMNVLAFATQLPIAVWQQHGAPLWTIFTAIIGVLWMLAPRGVPGRALGVFWCLPALLIVPVKPPLENGFEATILDVGQGLSVLVRTANHTLLYDTGPAYNETSDAGSRIVVPFLRYHAIYKLDAVIVSHADNDHAGGTRSIVAALPITDFYVPTSDTVPELPTQMFCRNEYVWRWDGVDFRFLSPDDELIEKSSSTNDRSCVLKIESPYGSLLLTGDIGTRIEKHLIKQNMDALKSNIMIAPHHGSKNSSSRQFIEAVAPEYAVFSVGYRNRYQFPRAEIVARYENRGADTLRTDQLGAVRFTVGEKGIQGEGFRVIEPRYWR
jgi:competence protein ComEC